jgi:SAM-dependent methyltransferase
MRQPLTYTGDDGQHYLEQRQSSQSDYVQSLRASLFRDLASEDLVILDFGCGTGGVLKRLSAARRIGVEVGEGAAEAARAQGIEIIAALEELPDASVDVAISFHAIEHVDTPLQVLQEIRRVVKPGGHIRLVVPCELPLLRAQRSWVPNRDRHLFTWTPLLFGNLAQRAGLQDIKTRSAPMPTGSRLVRGLGFLPPLSRLAHLFISLRRNNLNVILDARLGTGSS